MKIKYKIKGNAGILGWVDVRNLRSFDSYKEAKKYWNSNKELIREYQKKSYSRFAVFKTFEVEDQFKADLD